MLVTPDPRLKDLRAFTTMVWRYLDLPDPTPVQLDMLNWLQYGPDKIILQAFRGVGKSWLTSAYVAHGLYWDHTRTYLVVSAGRGRASEFSTFTKRLLYEVPFLKHMYPSKEQRASNEAFDVFGAPPNHAPSVKSVGITGQIVGSRAHEIIGDDIETTNNSATVEAREKLLLLAREFDSVRIPSKPGKPSRTIILGTPQTEESMLKKLEEKGYACRIWPARYVPASSQGRYRGNLAPSLLKAVEEDPRLIGTSTEPQRFDDTDLLKREMGQGRSGFNLQFMLDTSLVDANKYPLRLCDMVVMDLPLDKAPENVIWGNSETLIERSLPCVGLFGDRYHRPLAIQGSWLPYTGKVMAIDPSGRGTNETAYSVVGTLNGNLFVNEIQGLRSGYDDTTMVTIANAAKRHQVKRIIIEENFGQGMFAKLLQPHLARIYPCTIEEIRHNKQKELRIIDVMEPLLNQHKLIVSRAVVEADAEQAPDEDVGFKNSIAYQTFYQMSHMTRERGCLGIDDRVDSLAMACGYWVTTVAQDAEKRIKQRREEVEAKYFADFARKARSFCGLPGPKYKSIIDRRPRSTKR